MQQEGEKPGMEDVNGHPHYELFSGLRHICRAMELLNNSFEKTGALFLILDCVAHDQILNEKILTNIDSLRWDKHRNPYDNLCRQVSQACWSLDAADRHIAGGFEGELKAKIELRLRAQLEELHGLQREFEAIRDEMSVALQPYAIRERVLTALLLESRIIVAQVTDLVQTVTADGLGAELYNRLKKHDAVLRGIQAALSKWRANPSQKMARGFARCYRNWVDSYTDLNAMKESAEQECIRSGLRFMTRYGYKSTTASARRLGLRP